MTFPHVENLDEAKQILAVFQQEKIDVWSAANPKGEKLAMLMLEDPAAVAQAARIRQPEGLQHPRVRHRQPDAARSRAIAPAAKPARRRC